MQGEESEHKKANGSELSQTLSGWLEAHNADLLTALLPFAKPLNSTLGLPLTEIASELLVEVTRRALGNPDRYDPARPPKAWLLGIANNVALEWKDREIKWNLRFKHPLPAENVADPEPEDPLEHLVSNAQRDTDAVAIGNVWTENMLHQAPEPHREIIKTYMDTDFDTDETAIALGITNVNVRQRLFRARKWFKDRLHFTQESLPHGGMQ